MIKIVTTLKKRAGMSTADFRAYYETHHRVIGEKYLKGYAVRYLRRYLDALPDADGNTAESEFDVLLEIWFPDQDTYLACAAHLSQAAVAEEIIHDEEKLFDRSQKRSYQVVEHESEMNQPA